MTLIDTHCHLDSHASRGELDGVLARAKAAGVEAVIAIGTGPDDWTLNRDLARDRPGFVHYSVGMHPCSVGPGWEAALAGIGEFWNGKESPAPVALGECGLDRFHLPKDPGPAAELFSMQRTAFAAQLALARELRCPVVIHSRGAFSECVGMIDASGIDWHRVVFHCFSEGPAEMAEIARRGGRGSFTGIITYKKADNVRAALVQQGLDRLMVETDAPYLAPDPHRGKPNEPSYVRFTAESAANLLKVPYGELADATTSAARAFFGLG